MRVKLVGGIRDVFLVGRTGIKGASLDGVGSGMSGWREGDLRCLDGGKRIRDVWLVGRGSEMSGWREVDQRCLVGGKGIRDV